MSGSDGGAPAAVETTVDGIDAVELRAGRYAATFLPGLGMLGASLTCDGLEHLDLTGGLDRYREGHTTGLPLLHPWANRLARPTYEADGRWVDIDLSPPVHVLDGLPIHGTMTAATGWQVEAVLADASRALLQCRYDFGRDPVRLASFPFPHDLVVFAELSDLGLRVTTTVLATGSVPVPVSFGWHPYFTLPGVRRADLTVVRPDREQLELDGRMLPTGNLRSVAADTVLLGEGPDQNALDDAYRLGSGAADRRFLLTGTTADGETRSLRVEILDGYSYAQVYSPRNAALAAVEPMTAPINALVSGDHPSVAPGEQFAATFAVAVPAADPAPLAVDDADAATDHDTSDEPPS